MGYESTIQDVVATIESRPDTITLKNGVVLKTKRVPPLRITAVTERFKYPPIPEVYDSHRDRMIRNPESPEYLALRAEVDEQKTYAMIDALIAFGTEIETVPDGIPGVQDDAWVEEVTFMGIVVNTDVAVARYMAWVKYVALSDPADFPVLVRAFGLQMGAGEENVSAQMQANFPGNT